MSGASNFNVSCNMIKDFRYGIFAAGDNSAQGKLRGNTLEDHWIGLFLNESATIGIQEHHGNIWDGTFDEFGAKNLASQGIALMSQFIFDSDDNTKFEPPSISSVPNWFVDVTGISFICDEEETCPDGVGYQGLAKEWTVLDQALIAGDLGFDHYDKSLSWTGRFHTYHRLKDPGVLSLPPDITLFLSDESTTNIGKLSNALDSLHQAIRYSGIHLSALEDFSPTVQERFAYIAWLDLLWGTGRDTDSLLYQIRLRYDTLFGIIYDYTELLDVIAPIQETKRTSAGNYIKAITPDSVWQSSMKFTLLESISLLEEDELESSTDLYDLALLCPERYGDAVYHARSLIRQDSMLLKYDDITSCDSLVTRSIKDFVAYPARILPNPVSDHVQLHTTHPWTSVVVLSSNGQQHRTSVLSDSKSGTIINTSALPAGLYYIMVNYTDGRRGAYPFVKN